MNKQSRPDELILASSSRYRHALMERYAIPFRAIAPEIDESEHSDEAPRELTQRLAADKASVIAAQFPRAAVIGSDQVATFDGCIIGKPLTVQNAVSQLLQFSGNTVHFYTSVTVRCRSMSFLETKTVVTVIKFRRLDEAEIRRYIVLDDPLDCAGGFKSEAGGSMLLESMDSPDPTAIIGLPLIATSHLLRRVGYRLP